MTIHLEFTPDTLSILNDERYSHPVPLVQRRMEALWLKSHDLPHAQIAKLVGVCENTLRDYFELYQQGGVENLRTINYHRPESELCAYITSLEAYFKEHPPRPLRRHKTILKRSPVLSEAPLKWQRFLKKTPFTLPQNRDDSCQS
ncbi:MAG: helix-turn-helix domain-containing protein [Methylococcaceae bacterium]|jgi:hypothetical protein